MLTPAQLAVATPRTAARTKLVRWQLAEYTSVSTQPSSSLSPPRRGTKMGSCANAARSSGNQSARRTASGAAGAAAPHSGGTLSFITPCAGKQHAPVRARLLVEGALPTRRMCNLYQTCAFSPTSSSTLEQHNCWPVRKPLACCGPQLTEPVTRLAATYWWVCGRATYFGASGGGSSDARSGASGWRATCGLAKIVTCAR